MFDIHEFDALEKSFSESYVSPKLFAIGLSIDSHANGHRGTINVFQYYCMILFSVAKSRLKLVENQIEKWRSDFFVF